MSLFFIIFSRFKKNLFVQERAAHSACLRTLGIFVTFPCYLTDTSFHIDVVDAVLPHLPSILKVFIQIQQMQFYLIYPQYSKYSCRYSRCSSTSSILNTQGIYVDIVDVVLPYLTSILKVSMQIQQMQFYLTYP